MSKKKKKNKKDHFLAIRSENGYGIYEFGNKNEKTKILNKYPGCSCATFPDRTKAENWLNTSKIKYNKDDMIAYKSVKEKSLAVVEDNDILIKELTKENKKEETKNLISTKKEPEPPKENKKEITTLKTGYLKSELEKILDKYKSLGKKAVIIEFTDGSDVHLILEDFFYIKKNKFTFLDLDNVIYDLETRIGLKDVEISFQNLKKMFKETIEPAFGISEKDLEEKLVLESFVGVVKKDDYEIIDNFLYMKNAMPIIQKTTLDDGLLNMLLYKEINELREDVSFNLNNRIKFIRPYTHPAEITDETWLKILKTKRI